MYMNMVYVGVYITLYTCYMHDVCYVWGALAEFSGESDYAGRGRLERLIKANQTRTIRCENPNPIRIHRMKCSTNQMTRNVCVL